MTLLLAGDIGGTKTILQAVESTEKGLNPIFEAKYLSQDFADLVPIAQQFLATAAKEVGQELHPEKACFAIAGPVADDRCTLTNLSWVLDGRRLEKELGIAKVSLINDFAAIGYGVFGLKPEDIHSLQDVQADKTAPIAIIGAGTGLGEGFVIPQGTGYRVFASEGGHADFAPRNELEFKLLKYFHEVRKLQRVSVERVVSGMGIAAIYEFLKSLGEIPESSEIEEEIAKEDADIGAIVSRGATEKGDRLCKETLDLFIDAYGAEAGNLALKLLPYGGLYIAGGIAAKILPVLREGKFMTAFKTKGRVSPVLNNVPIHVILNPQVGLLGAGIHANQL
ncbi:glucokinase [Spirulina sp. 06S082]|uniref:glucokinase n=1 Tax=Spirulina sp. 06S082 TaxID=3110248 RepID=UPI002B1FC013|nr:glucokinase [Spirulina sp. 06S082]MEA5471368.1 glucokinase [Spirulina sp. 06S082]